MPHVTRAFVRFRNNPSSLRFAAAAIVSATVVLVLGGTIAMRLFAPKDYSSFGDAFWFSLQTVTTVGYGDDTPESLIGRVIASIVMLVSIGLITVVTAAVTSLFIQSISHDQERADQAQTSESLARIEVALAEAQARLEAIESASAVAEARNRPGDDEPE